MAHGIVGMKRDGNQEGKERGWGKRKKEGGKMKKKEKNRGGKE